MGENSDNININWREVLSFLATLLVMGAMFYGGYQYQKGKTAAELVTKANLWMLENWQRNLSWSENGKYWYEENSDNRGTGFAFDEGVLRTVHNGTS